MPLITYKLLSIVRFKVDGYQSKCFLEKIMIYFKLLSQNLFSYAYNLRS